MNRYYYDQKSVVCEGCFFYEKPEGDWRPIGGCSKCGYSFTPAQGMAPDCDERRTEKEYKAELAAAKRKEALERKLNKKRKSHE